MDHCGNQAFNAAELKYTDTPKPSKGNEAYTGGGSVHRRFQKNRKKKLQEVLQKPPPTLKTQASSPENKGITSPLLKFVRGRKREEKPLAEEKDMREGLNGECLTESDFIDCSIEVDSLLQDFDGTDNKEVKVYRRWGKSWYSKQLKQPATLAELAMDEENVGIISDMLRFVRDKEIYRKEGKPRKRGYWLIDSPGTTDRSSLIVAMANRVEFDIYDLTLTGLTSISELTNVLLSIRNRSLIAIKDFDHWAGKLPYLKNELTPSCLSKIIHGLLSSCGDERIIVLSTNHNHIDGVDVALLRSLNNDLYIHTPSPQPKALSNGGEIVLLDSSEQKPTVDFDATNNRAAYQSDVLVSNSEEKSTREASRRQCMPEGVPSLVLTDSDALDNNAHLVRAYLSGPIVFNSEKKDTGEGLNRECLTKSALSLDDSKPRSLPDFDATKNKAVKVYTRRGRGFWHSMEELEQRTTLEELRMDPKNEGIISDLLRFVMDKEEFYKKAGKDWKRGYFLYDSPGTDRLSLIAAMANCLEFDIYHLDLTGFTSISELTNVLLSIRNRSLIAIKDFDHWAGKLPDVQTELTLSSLSKIIHGLLSSCGDERIIVLTTNHNHIGSVDSALLRSLNIDLYIHTSSPQPKALPDGGEIVLLDPSEQKPLVDFDATNNRACQNDVLVSNSEEKNTREASRRQCIPESVPSLVDSTTRISLMDFDAPDNSAHLVMAYQSGPIVFNLEKKDMGEVLSRECLTKSVLSLDDSSKQKSLSDVAVTGKKSHIVRAYESGPVVSFSDDKNGGEALKRECITKSILGLEDLQQHSGGRGDDDAKSFCGIHTSDSLARISFEVLKTLPTREQPNDCVPSLSLGRLTVEDCVQQEKSPDQPRVTQINGVEQRVTKLPRYFGGLTAQSDIGLPDGGHILSLSEKKIVRKTLKRKCRTMSVLSLEDHQQHVGRRWEDTVKFLRAKRICRQLVIHRETTTKHIRRQLGTRRWLFKQSAIGLTDGGHILYLPEKKIVRKTLKRKCRSISVLSLEDHEQHDDRRWEDAAKSRGTKRIRRQLVIHRLSTAKRTHKQHGIHQWPIQRSAIGLPDGGHILSLSDKKIVRKTLKRKCRRMSVLSLVDRQQHVDRRWEDAAKDIGAKRICRQLVIHRVSISKRICRQHGIHHRWPFERTQDWATMKGYSLGDERPVEVIRLSTDGKLVSRRRRIYISWLGRFSPWRSALPGRGLIVGPIALSASEFAGTNNIAQRVRQNQRGSGSSGSENERTREQEDPKEINTKINSNDLRRLLGRMKRSDAAKFLGVSLSTFKRACRACGINEWPRVERKKGADWKKKRRKKDEWRPPDQHGGNNPSPTCRTMATNGLTEMQNEMVGLELNEIFLDYVEGPNGWNTEICSIAGMSGDWDVFDALEEESTPCQHPMPTIPDMMPHLSCSEPALFQQPMPTIPDTMPTVHTMPHLACFEPAPCQQPMPTIPSTMPTIHTMPHLAFSEPAPCQQPMPTIPSTMPTIHTMPHLSCSEPALCQQPMPTIPSTMPTIHTMPHLACSEPAPCQQPMPAIPVTMPHLSAREDMRFVTLKVTYGKEILRFLFPLMSGIIELKEEVKKRLKLELDSFNIKYEDEEGDRIFLACDEDLRYHLQLFSNQIIRLLVVDSDSNTSNFR